VELSKVQDIEAGDGTITVVVIAGSLLDAASRLVTKSLDNFQQNMLGSADLVEEISVGSDKIIKV
jgi:T-complex protein 1 subunit delta